MEWFKKIRKRCNEKLRKLTITRRLIIVFTCVTIIPIFLICFLSSAVYSKFEKEKVSNSVYQMLLTYNIMVSKELEEQKNASYILVAHEKILTMLESAQEVSPAEGNEILHSLIMSGSWSVACENIIITDLQNQVRGSMATDWMTLEQLNHINEQMGAANDCWVQAKTLRGSHVLVFAKKIFSENTSGRQLGYLYMIYNENRFFETVYKNFKLDEDSTIFLLGEHGFYLSAQTEKEKIGTNLFNENPSVIPADFHQNYFIKDYNGSKSLYVVCRNKLLKGYLTAVVPLSYINGDIQKIFLFMFVFGIFMVMVSVLPILTVSSTIIKPIKKLSGFMEQVAAEDYHITIRDESRDEVGILTQNCDGMVKHLVQVMAENEQRGVLQRKLEFQRLQAQINPHFLFNTLNSFKYIAMMNDVPVLEEGITSFCNLLRQTIMPGEELIPMEQEFENVSNYCMVQQMRYAGEFELVQELSEEVRQVKIPRMLLQPLVENSLLHGIKKDILLTIRLRAFRDNGKVVVVVGDDGNGMETEQEVGSKSVCFNHVGLSNVLERLELVFGERVSFYLLTSKGEGTEIRLEIGEEDVSGIIGG